MINLIIGIRVVVRLEIFVSEVNVFFAIFKKIFLKKSLGKNFGNIMVDPLFYNALYGVNYRLLNGT